MAKKQKQTKKNPLAVSQEELDAIHKKLDKVIRDDVKRYEIIRENWELLGV